MKTNTCNPSPQQNKGEIISVDTEKTFDEILTTTYKISSKLGIEGEFPTLIMNILTISITNTIVTDATMHDVL